MVIDRTSLSIKFERGRIQIMLVVGRLRGDRICESALISLTDEDLKDPRAEKLQWAPNRSAPLAGFAVSGSTLFSVGGLKWAGHGGGFCGFLPSREMHRVNAFGRPHVWTQGPSMAAGRLLPQVVAVDEGKLYVFGGVREEYVPWAEEYDMKSGKWSDLGAPKDIDRRSTADPCCLLDTEINGVPVKKFLFYDCYGRWVYAYDLIKDEWDVDFGKMLEKIKITEGDTHLVASGKFIFIISVTAKWVVLDLESKKRRKVCDGNQLLDINIPRIDILTPCRPRNVISLGYKDGVHGLLLLFWVRSCLYVMRIKVMAEGRYLHPIAECLGSMRLEEDIELLHCHAIMDVPPSHISTKILYCDEEGFTCGRVLSRVDDGQGGMNLRVLYRGLSSGYPVLSASPLPPPPLPSVTESFGLLGMQVK